MEKLKIAMVYLIILLSFAMLLSWKNKNNGMFFQNEVNWQWNDDWNSSNLMPLETSPPSEQPNLNQELRASTYEEAKALAKQHNKSILAVFGADWCSWCKKLDSETLSDPKVKDLVKNYVFVKINADNDRDVLRKFGVVGLPTCIIIGSDERELKKNAGFMDATSMAAWLQ